MNHTTTLSPQRTTLITWILLCLMPIIGMAVDLLAPALPPMANSLHIANSLVQDLISIYLLGYAFGNFFAGLIADAYGRKPLLIMALLGFIITSFLPILFPNITLLLLSRLLQGISLGFVAVVIRAVFSDILCTDQLVRMGTWIGTMWGLGPVIGPVIGGYLTFYLGWQSCFEFLALITLIGLITVWGVVPETHHHHHRKPLSFSSTKHNITEVFRSKLFLGIVVVMGTAYSLLITFQTTAPFLIQNVMGNSPVFFGHLALYLGIVFLIATFVGRGLLKKYPVDKLLSVSIPTATVIAVLSLGASYCFSHSIVLISIASALMFFACGFIFPLSAGKGLALSKKMSIVANAMMFLMNILITSLTSFIVSFFTAQSAVLLTGIYVALLLIAMVVYWGMVRQKNGGLRAAH